MSAWPLRRRLVIPSLIFFFHSSLNSMISRRDAPLAHPSESRCMRRKRKEEPREGEAIRGLNLEARAAPRKRAYRLFLRLDLRQWEKFPNHEDDGRVHLSAGDRDRVGRSRKKS